MPGLAGAGVSGLANTPWPMFHHDIRHTGQSPYLGAQTNTVKWTYTAGDSVRSSPAIGSDGTIYFGAHGGTLYAIDPNGDKKWSFNTGGPIQCSPAIASDGTIYVGSSDLYAINPNGTLKWRFVTDSSVGSATIASDGTVYVGSNLGILYAVNPNGTLKWFYTTGDIIGESSPAISSDGTIYIGTHVENNPSTMSDDEGKLYAITDNITSGVLKWTFPTGYWINSSPAIGSDGTIYFGAYDSFLYAVTDNSTNAIQKWRFNTAGEVQSSPAIGSDGTIYVGSFDYTGGGKLYAINPTNGSQKWAANTTNDIGYSSPAIGSDSTIYIADGNGRKVYAFKDNGSSGDLTWSYTTGGIVLSSPAIGSDGTVYIGSDDRKLYAFGTSPHITSVSPNSGSQGKTLNNVIITGNNLSGTTLVSFGADITVGALTVSDTQIIISSISIGAGATPGTRDVTVTNPAGTGTKTNCFTVSVPLPNVYVNDTTGNNNYDGSSPLYTSGTTGPKKTIAAGITVVSNSGTVYVAAGTYHEHGLRLSETMNLVGAGALTTIIDGDASGVVLEVSSQPFQRNTISGFTIQNGAATVTDFGGGIYISQAHIVTINDCAIINNTKLASIDHETNWGEGAGICNDGGALYMNRCTVSGNTALFSGGGILTRRTFGGDSGLVELTNCTISENAVNESDGQGGGIWNAGTLTINNSCISGNHASKGNGIHTMPAATATLTNCTISGNSGNGAGGGIRNWGSMWCYSVTISENQGGVGGGFSNDGAPARMYFKNCIVANNIGDDGIHNNGYDDLNGTGISSLGYNIDSENSCYFTQPTDKRNTNPQLGPLQNNGGPTSTHAITASSPAYNTGTNSGAPTTDQRGITRPQMGTCDIGAYEFSSSSVATATGTGTATFSTSIGGISTLSALSTTPCGAPPSGLSFPHGFFSFTVTNITPGATVTITITFPSNVPMGTQYWKCINGQWVNCTSLLGDNDGDNILTLTITDGGTGDTDGQANGTIVDPGGPARLLSTSTATSQEPSSSYLPERSISAPAKLTVKYLNVQPQQAQANQPVTVYANITNSGDESGSYSATLKVNGQVEETRLGKVGGHAAVPLMFMVSREKPGSYSVDVNGQQASFIIIDDGGNKPAPTKDWAIIGFVICAIGVVVVSVLLIQRRRNAY